MHGRSSGPLDPPPVNPPFLKLCTHCNKIRVLSNTYSYSVLSTRISVIHCVNVCL